MYELQRYRKVTFAIITGLLLILCGVIALPFWQAIGWGCTLALLFAPVHQRLQKRFSNTVSSLLTTLIAIFGIGIPLALVGWAIANDANDIGASLRAPGAAQKFSLNRTADDLNAQIRPIASEFGLSDFDVRNVARSFVEPAINSAPQIAERFIKGVIVVIFAFILLFFLLRDVHKLREPFFDLMPLPKEKAEALLLRLYHSVHATFQGILFVAAIQGLLLGVMFWALGLPAPGFAGLVGFVVCTIPFAGAPVFWVPTAVFLAVQDRWIEAACLAAGGILLLGIIETFVRPVIIGARTRLHTATVFFAVIGGMMAFGPIGVFMGPLLATACIGVIDVLRESRAGEGAAA
jgi:predicted PurR-regulated permease PerM